MLLCLKCVSVRACSQYLCLFHWLIHIMHFMSWDRGKQLIILVLSERRSNVLILFFAEVMKCILNSMSCQSQNLISKTFAILTQNNASTFWWRLKPKGSLGMVWMQDLKSIVFPGASGFATRNLDWKQLIQNLNTWVVWL